MTPKQKLVLDFIEMYIKIKGYPPSYINIAHGLGMKSKSNIHRLVHKLRKEGHIKIQPHLVRSIKLSDQSVNEINDL
jgi:repressor LexA